MSDWAYRLDAVQDDGSVDITILRDAAEVYSANLSQILLGTPQVIVENPDAPLEQQTTHVVDPVGRPPVGDAQALDTALQAYLASYAAGTENAEAAIPVVSKDVQAIIGQAVTSTTFVSSQPVDVVPIGPLPPTPLVG